MNCLAHAYRFLDNPHFAAGTCIPDWLGMVNRQCRIKRSALAPFLQTSTEPSIPQAIAAGIQQHLADDQWFHEQTAFAELCAQLSQSLARALSPDPGMRPRFSAHVLVEMLIDAEIEQRSPGTVTRYYEVVSQIDPEPLLDTLAHLTTRPCDEFQAFFPRFLEERYLADYLDDTRLMRRLNGVLRRVKLAALPDSVRNLLPAARAGVHARFDELLPTSKVPGTLLF